jgi:hypothetical protein
LLDGHCSILGTFDYSVKLGTCLAVKIGTFWNWRDKGEIYNSSSIGFGDNV